VARRKRSMRLSRASLRVRAYLEFESHSLRHRSLREQSLPPRRVLRKPNIRGLFALDLLTGFAVPRAIWLSLRPILSKAVDCRI